MSITIQHGKSKHPHRRENQRLRDKSFPINATIIESFPASNHSLEVLRLISSLILYTVVNITNIHRMRVKIRQIDSVTQPRVIQRVRIQHNRHQQRRATARPLPSPAITFVEPLHSLNLVIAYLYTTKSPLENKYHSCKTTTRKSPLSMHPRRKSAGI